MKSARRRSRELALQGLYAWQLSGDDAAGLQAQLAESKEFGKADSKYFARLLQGTIEHAGPDELRAEPHPADADRLAGIDGDRGIRLGSRASERAGDEHDGQGRGDEGRKARSAMGPVAPFSLWPTHSPEIRRAGD